MAMSSPLGSSEEMDVIMDINTTPLIDVMLVLLVMMIITIPIQLHAVKLELPVGRPPVNAIKPEVIQIDIDAMSSVHWQGQTVALDQLEENMRQSASAATQPEVHLRTDKDASYAVFAKVLASSRRLGLNRIAVVGSEQFVQ
jgi:biopolymer transport protein ExbD